MVIKASSQKCYEKTKKDIVKRPLMKRGVLITFGGEGRIISDETLNKYREIYLRESTEMRQ